MRIVYEGVRSVNEEIRSLLGAALLVAGFV